MTPSEKCPLGSLSRPPEEIKEALLLEIGVVRWRPRFYLQLQIDDKILRYYGTRKSLAQHLTRLGLEITAMEIVPGLQLDLRCRASTYRAGELQIVHRLLPLQPSQEE